MQDRNEQAGHRLAFKPAETQLVVHCEGRQIAASSDAIWLCEGNYPPVAYFPREDCDFSHLRASEAKTRCPYKGTANYFSLAGNEGETLVCDIAWSYETPIEQAQAITGYLAFYPNKTKLTERDI